MQKETEPPSKNLMSDETFAAAAKLLEGKSEVLDNILTSMGDGLSIQDRNMRIVYQNRFMIDHFGSHIGEFCYNIYERRESICEGCPIVEAYRTEKVTKALRVGVTKDGEKFRFENIASVLRNDQGEMPRGSNWSVSWRIGSELMMNCKRRWNNSSRPKLFTNAAAKASWW